MGQSAGVGHRPLPGGGESVEYFNQPTKGYSAMAAAYYRPLLPSASRPERTGSLPC